MDINNSPYFKALDACMEYLRTADSVSKFDDFPVKFKSEVETLKKYNSQDSKYVGYIWVQNAWKHYRKLLKL